VLTQAYRPSRNVSAADNFLGSVEHGLGFLLSAGPGLRHGCLLLLEVPGDADIVA
jgi:hypothetical protein